MLAPTPVLKPSPLDIGGLFSASFEALKRRLGLLILITLLPSLFMMAAVAVGLAVMVPAFVAAANGSRFSLTAGLLVGIAVMIVGALAAILLQLKSYGMLSLAAYEIAQGQLPDFRGVLARSRGFLPRMASVIAITAGAVIALYGLLIIIMVGAFSVAGPDGRSGGAAAMFALLILVFLALIPLSLFLATRFLYTVPAVALEGLGGIDGMKRSWRLTRGAFWRTLGYYLLAALAVAAVSYAVSLVGQLAMIPFGLSMSSISDTSQPGQVLAALATLIPAMVILSVLQVAVQVLTFPFQQSYITYMFIDQVRRSEMPATPPYGHPGGGYYAQPGQYYAPQPDPQQPYPPQGQAYPAQGWQAPGGWTPPGQAQPPQQPGQQYPPPQGWNGGQQGQQPPPGQGPTQG